MLQIFLNKMLMDSHCKIDIMQIRVHLQCAGHPIANDMLYLSSDGPLRSAKGASADRAALGTSELPISDSRQDDSYAEDALGEGYSIDPMCTNCPNLSPKGYGSFRLTIKFSSVLRLVLSIPYI